MTTLEQLVPPFELCRKIPKDAFNDTALVWKTYHRGIISDNPYVAERDTWDHEFREDPEQPIVPAPTAQEILEALQPHFPHVSCGWRTNLERSVPYYKCTAHMAPTESCRRGKEFLCSGENLPEILLKLWLDVRRVKREAKNDQAVSDDSNNS